MGMGFKRPQKSIHIVSTLHRSGYEGHCERVPLKQIE